mgnify:CR=1 FL=1
MSEPAPGQRGLLDRLERVGNALPDPSLLFLGGALLVMVLSWLATAVNWEVQRMDLVPSVDANGNQVTELVPRVDPETGVPVVERATNLLQADEIFWALNSMVDNFMGFAPLGIVLVGMLGVGVAERTGLIGALLKVFMLITPIKLLTPATVFIGVMSSAASDAGYVVLPPLAALLFKSVGRSPVVGIAAVFAGVSAGFSANLLPTGLDPILAGYTQEGVNVLDPEYAVNPLCNYYFMIASTIMATLVGWATTAWFVEPRFNRKSPEQGGPEPMDPQLRKEQRVTAAEFRGMNAAGTALFLVAALLVACIAVPGWPLHGVGANFDRWVEAIVPILFILFVIPGIVYGVSTGVVKSSKDVAKLMMDSMASMAPIIVLAFFAAQFIEYFSRSNLGTMLAISGGEFLATAGLPTLLLLVVFILLTAVFNLFVGSMSAKYALFAPIFVPMFMVAGISPELTQVAYRVGDSVTNIITPLNAYLVIVLVFLQKYVSKGGMGTLIAMMLPYSIAFTIAWCIMLAIWMGLGLPLGVDGHLSYPPAGR